MSKIRKAMLQFSGWRFLLNTVYRNQTKDLLKRAKTIKIIKNLHTLISGNPVKEN